MTSFAASSVSVSAMTAEEEFADYSISLRPHAAYVGQEDGITHVRLMPDRASAEAWAFETVLAAHAAGNFRSMTVRPA